MQSGQRRPIVEYRVVREEPYLLDDVPYLAAERDWIQIEDGGPVDQNVSFVRVDEPVDHF